MSTIEKLTIQGIRSFGANPEDVQSITFSSPLTLILGENGCGKTTIIECLKYALTGELPPSSDRGKSFVHDPKIFSLNDSLGQIKLQARNIRGERVSVCRSMKITNRRGKYSFETLDSSMNHGDDSISKRCVDMDVAMCNFMGVSKAIINNVLFCHQEDSSWPLDEAKKLKEKFDAIFGISEYNKAIEKFIKMRKEEVESLKVKDANLSFLAHLKQEMETKSMALQQAEEKCESIKTQCNEIDEAVKPIDQRLEQIRKIEYDVAKTQVQKAELETKLKNCTEQIKNINKKIKKIFEGNMDELNEEISSFGQKMLEKKREVKEMNDQMNILKKQEKSIQAKLNDLDKKKSLCTQQLQKEKQSITKRSEKIESICSLLDIKLDVDVKENLESVPSVIEEIKTVLEREKTKINETSSQHDREDQDRQSEIEKLRIECAKLEESIASLNKQKQSYEKERVAAEKKVKDAEVSSNRLNKITDEIRIVGDNYEAMNTKLNQESIRNAITSAKDKVTKLQEEYRKVDERLTLVNSISKLMAEIELKEKELTKKEQDVRRIKSKHSDNFEKVFDSPIEQNYRRTLQTIHDNLRRQIKQINDKCNAMNLKSQSFEIERKNLKKELTRLEKELEDSKEKVFQKCHSTPYEELLCKSKETVSRYQLELGALRSAEAMYKRYIRKIGDDPCCPLCHKAMTGNEAVDLTAELTDEIQHLPENIKTAETNLKMEQKKYEALLKLQPVIEKLERLEVDVPKKKDDLKNVEAKLAECTEEKESMQMLLAEPTTKMELSNLMMGDMSILDEAIKEIARIKDDITKLKDKLPSGADSDVSIDELQAQKASIFSELENDRAQVEKMQQDFEKAKDALNKLRERKNSLKDEQIRLQEGLQSIPQVKERITELTQLLETIIAEIQENKSKIPPIKEKLKQTVSEKSRLKESNRQIVAKMQAAYESYKNIDHDIQRLHKEVLDYQKLDLTSEISSLEESIKKVGNELKEKNDEIQKKADELESLRTECSKHDSLERDLKDNRELKLLQQKEVTLNEQKAELHKQFGSLDITRISREKSEMVKEREKSTVRKGELLGQIGEVNNQINKLKKEIDEPKFKNSLQNYRRAFYEAEVSRRIINDLGQYRAALEHSLLEFHAEKMETINRLIREYWRLIYRGNDIDYIQIQTDAEELKADAIDRRRNYNYRVIQSKNNSEIEMRGRCSAGQRVLACLIIRMALAETFSSNCGVLALDEPTTNLDRMNIISLCDALNRIVEERETQSNFMLVIITHDEEFISTLGKINSYHRVFRNDESKSVIRQVKVV